MATKSKGAKLEYGNTADFETATTWTEIGRLISFKPATRKSKDIDTTVLASESEEKEPGLPSADGAEFKAEYDKTRAGALDAIFNTPKAWRATYSDGSGRLWNGWISELGEEEVKNNEILTQAGKLSITKLDEFAADVDA